MFIHSVSDYIVVIVCVLITRIAPEPQCSGQRIAELLRREVVAAGSYC